MPWHPHTYDPHNYLYKYVDAGNKKSWLDPKQPKIPIKAVGMKDDSVVYASQWGTLHPDIRDKFAHNFIWKSELQNNTAYIPIANPIKPPPKDAPRDHPQMERIHRAGMRYATGPQEWQQVLGQLDPHTGLLPEAKVWQHVGSMYKPFPLNVGKGSRQTWTLETRTGRTKDEQEKMKQHIRDLVREKRPLMPQYVKPYPYQVCMKQTQARYYEPLEAPPDRNPPPSLSSCHAVHRSFPSAEYRPPKFPITSPFARLVSLNPPYLPNISTRKQKETERMSQQITKRQRRASRAAKRSLLPGH